MTNDPNYLEAALLRAMALLASLNAAVELASAMRARKAGRDPSAEERSEVVLPELREEISELKAIVFQLESSLALSAETEEPVDNYPAAKPVNRFIDLMRLQKAGGALQRIHQRLLSLYPAVHESLIEEARLLKNACEGLADVDSRNLSDPLIAFLNRTRRFARAVEGLI